LNKSNDENEKEDQRIEIPMDAFGMRINPINREIEYVRKDSGLNNELFWTLNANDYIIDFKTNDGENVKVLANFILNFSKRVLENLSSIIDLIIATKNQRECVLTKSTKMLNEFIFRAENN